MSKILKEKERGSLIVVSGPSGCGKGTVIQEFLKKHKDAWLSISCTSRKPRPGDEEGVTYFFISQEEFEQRIDEGAFLEFALKRGPTPDAVLTSSPPIVSSIPYSVASLSSTLPNVTGAASTGANTAGSVATSVDTPLSLSASDATATTIAVSAATAPVEYVPPL